VDLTFGGPWGNTLQNGPQKVFGTGGGHFRREKTSFPPLLPTIPGESDNF
jgi:hypothetical protein